MPQKNKSLTIMFIPDGKGKTISVHVRQMILWIFIAFLIIVIGGMATLIYLAGDIAVKLQLVSLLENENRKLKQENNKLQQTILKIDNIKHINEYFLRILSSSSLTKKEGTTVGKVVIDHPLSNKVKEAKETLNVLEANLRLTHDQKRKEHSNRDTATKNASIESALYLRPVEKGWITKMFTGSNDGSIKEHFGVDFASEEGTPIRAAGPGIVKESRSDEYFGLIVVLEHLEGFETRYAHCSELLVKVGDRVERGQIIAKLGNTGNSSAPHLHYEIIKNGKPTDPLRYMLE